MLPIVLIILLSAFSGTHAASTCYACTNCGTTWDITKASMVQTGDANNYCRKTVTGTNVVKDYSALCTPLNVLGNGVFCCQTDLCNSANGRSITMINLAFSTAVIWIMYHYMY